MSSISRDWMRRIWDDIYPTVEASQDDYKKAYLELGKEQADQRSELVTAMLEYIEEHQQEGQKNFWRWWIDQRIDQDK